MKDEATYLCNKQNLWDDCTDQQGAADVEFSQNLQSQLPGQFV